MWLFVIYLAEARLPHPRQTHVSRLCQGAGTPTESKQVTGAKFSIHVLAMTFNSGVNTKFCQDLNHDPNVVGAAADE